MVGRSTRHARERKGQRRHDLSEMVGLPWQFAEVFDFKITLRGLDRSATIIGAGLGFRDANATNGGRHDQRPSCGLRTARKRYECSFLLAGG